MSKEKETTNRYLLMNNDARETIGSISFNSKVEEALKKGYSFELHPSIHIGPEGPMLVGVYITPNTKVIYSTTGLSYYYSDLEQ